MDIQDFPVSEFQDLVDIVDSLVSELQDLVELEHQASVDIPVLVDIVHQYKVHPASVVIPDSQVFQDLVDIRLMYRVHQVSVVIAVSVELEQVDSLVIHLQYKVHPVLAGIQDFPV